MEHEKCRHADNPAMFSFAPHTILSICFPSSSCFHTISIRCWTLHYTTNSKTGNFPFSPFGCNQNTLFHKTIWRLYLLFVFFSLDDLNKIEENQVTLETIEKHFLVWWLLHSSCVSVCGTWTLFSFVLFFAALIWRPSVLLSDVTVY